MKDFSDALLNWYDSHRRSLPWRGTTDPYRIWLSEIMLQQTRAETVIRYYERFLARFPTVQDLAAASEDEVLKLWEGLGYYSRARNLHAAAKQVSAECGGSFPDASDGLRRLPGVGPYAANAIASIAYGECVPALDGNQARVLSRILAWNAPLKTPFDLLTEAENRISADRPGDYNQALMDLGSGICIPKKPRCGDCPLAAFCRGLECGDPESFPRKNPPTAKREEAKTLLLVQIGPALCVRKRPSRGMLAGLFEFPMTDGHLSPEEIAASLLADGFSGVQIIRRLPDAKHVFTHRIWRMQGWQVTAETAPKDWLLLSDLNDYAFPSALAVYRKAAEDLLRG